MQLYSLERSKHLRRGQRVGRGGKRGTTAGRGTKGQKARAGHKIRPEMRDVIKRIPKLRGYKFRSFQTPVVAISLTRLEDAFAKGDIVSMRNLARKKMISTRNGKLPRVKILGNTPMSKNLSLVGIPVSKSARAMIENAGGSVRK
ncbi:MAG: uL15 family ribosomal protein [Candidatus Sungbacteria bacterium]|uniref:Large ribosomal subunit protein uL15 n=1 Tax=Candidatus Sungiibacteriota bacterium TaxID=2750080 RepID=A0A9D6LTN5_9BACT|nr:uL15 family ribosomal protein [Candidatus Sungbacteria bacterium]